MNQKEFSVIFTSLMHLVYQHNFMLDLTIVDADTPDDIRRYYAELIDANSLIKQTIENNLVNYSFNSLNLVDQAILKVATYFLIRKQISGKLVIDTAISVTKEFSDLDDEKQHKFNNKVLDNIFKSLQ